MEWDKQKEFPQAIGGIQLTMKVMKTVLKDGADVRKIENKGVGTHLAERFLDQSRLL